MKEIFVPKNFNPAHALTIERANQILTDYRAQGYDLSLRQLFYQFVTKNWIENSERSYKNLGNIIGDARLAGLLDWDSIKDRGRLHVDNSHWETPADIIDSAASSFRIDKWARQPNYVEIMVEKQALEGVLIPVATREDVVFTANKGYSSLSYLYEAGKRYARKMAEGKKVHAIYLGDHDPSGIDMTRDVSDRASMFARSGINMHRVALNMDQIEELHPPEQPAKRTDSRHAAYRARFGDSSWELDAVEPRSLDQIVTKQIRVLRDNRLWRQDVATEQEGREKLEEYARQYREEN